MKTLIHPETFVGQVCLKVHDLDLEVTFYNEALGFELITRDDSQAELGAGGKTLLTLVRPPNQERIQGKTGLYHFAILLPGRADLARFLLHLSRIRTQLQGFADHWVSEAIYLTDPEGNGIEVYRDRPRSEWPSRDGKLQMATEPLDIDGIMSEISQADQSWQGFPGETKLGHMHLRVSDLSKAEKFYTGTIGFDLVTRYGGAASFVSAGGYHHHIGFNTWDSLGAPITPKEALGLNWYTIEMPTPEDVAEVIARVSEAGIKTKEIPEGTYLQDPSGNGIIIRPVSKMA